MSLIRTLEKEAMQKQPPHFQAGDTVRVHTKIKEGDKERIQIFEGVVLKRQGTGIRATFTVRRIVQGIGVERTFPIHSPRVEKIEVVRHGKVNRAKLYYLRNRIGLKARRIEERTSA